MIRQREPRQLDPKFLAFVRRQPCCICGATRGVEAAHIRMGNPDLGKMPAGMQQKPDDRWVTPLCGPDLTTNRPGCHARQHEVREIDFWMFHGKDPFAIAARLYAEYGGVGGQPRQKRKTVKPRPLKHMRQKIQNRGFQRKESK